MAQRLAIGMGGEHQADVAAEVEAVEMRQHDAGFAEPLRHDGDAKAGTDIAQCLVVAGRAGGEHRPDAARGKETTGLRQQLAVAANDHRVVDQLLGADHRLAGERMRLTERERIAFAEQPQPRLGRVAVAQQRQRKVDAAAREPFAQVTLLALDDLEPVAAGSMALVEQHVFNPAPRRRHQHAEPQRAYRRRFRHRALRFRKSRLDRPCRSDQPGASVGQRDAAVGAVEQAAAERLLQLGDAHRQRRLRHVARSGGAREIAGIDHRQEIAEVVAVDHRRFL